MGRKNCLYSQKPGQRPPPQLPPNKGKEDKSTENT